jgi:hypothetical protein
LPGHAFRFDLGSAAGEGQDGPQIFGAGVVAFETTPDAAPTAADGNAA